MAPPSSPSLIRHAARRLAAALQPRRGGQSLPLACPTTRSAGAARAHATAPAGWATVAWNLVGARSPGGRPQRGAGSGGRGYAASAADGEEWLEHDFHREVDEVLEVLQEEIEIYVEERDLGPDADVTYMQGVLNVVLGDLGTFVINKQTPNRQIWLSSPVSGPFRYDLIGGEWVYARDGHRLVDKLTLEIGELCGAPLELPL